MKPSDLRSVIEETITTSLDSMGTPGIEAAALTELTVSPKQLQRLGLALETKRHAEIRCSAEAKLLLRVSNVDVFRSLQTIGFRVRVEGEGKQLKASARTELDWASAWEKGIEPIREAALNYMKADVWEIDSTLSEESYTFKAAMVLLASEMVGPYASRLASFLRYPVSLVQVIGARLQEAGIWEQDEVHCEDWFDAKRGGIELVLAVMIAEGKMVRRRSSKDEEYKYRILEDWTSPHLSA
jgi:hypothetical protein